MGLITWNEVLEKVKADTIRVEESTKEIWEKILSVAIDALEKDVVWENNMQLENLKHKVQEIFFTTIGLILKQNLTKATDFLSIWHTFQWQESVWEIAFAECSNDLDMREYKVNALPLVTIEEVNTIVSKFIQYNVNKEDKDAPPQG